MRRRALYLGVLGVLGLSLATGALAATGPLVPASGKVAGKGYAFYLKRLQLIAIATDGRIPSCSTVNVGGQKVAMLNPPGGGRTVTCNEPAGGQYTWPCSATRARRNRDSIRASARATPIS